jgi:hypothetical protein
MYCVKCGVKLADTEKKCPLCDTVVYHPDIVREKVRPLYPVGKMPKLASERLVLSGAAIILFMIPLITTFFSDMLYDGKIDWCGYVAGGIVLAYMIFALPMWFKKPNPVIFVPCDFAACALYLLYINLKTGGKWFLTFAFPLCAGLALVTCTLVTLLRYLRKGRLYVIGGSLMGYGVLVFAVEVLMTLTFGFSFKGWSFYPMTSMVLVGGMLIYLAINSVMREKIERRLFV